MKDSRFLDFLKRNDIPHHLEGGELFVNDEDLLPHEEELRKAFPMFRPLTLERHTNEVCAPSEGRSSHTYTLEEICYDCKYSHIENGKVYLCRVGKINKVNIENGTCSTKVPDTDKKIEQ